MVLLSCLLRVGVVHPALRCCCFLVLVLLAQAPQGVLAQKWAADMFSAREHDYGTVAKNADAIHEFEFQNLYQEEVVIRSVRSSCGCITPSYTTKNIGSLETGKIVAKFNTDRFVGQRSATVTVTFEKPFFAEVQLKATGFIRGDVVLEPGKLDFGSSASFGDARKSLLVDYRGGMSNWQIVDVTSTFPHVRVSLKETQRQRGRVIYSVNVRLLPEVAAGLHQTDLVLITNDPNNREIPISVAANVLEPIQVIPTQFDLGDVEPGQQITKHILVRSSEQCQISSAIADNPLIVPTASGEAKNMHKIPIVFTAGKQAGPITATVTIKTSQGSSQTVAVHANVVGTE
jgi:hypothetical protein